MNPQPKPEPRPKKARRPLKRSWIRRKRPRRLSRAGSDPTYLDFVRSLPCMLSPGGCAGRVHAHHAIHLSQGGVDRDAVPLCAHHHKSWHESIGAFRLFNKTERWAWAVQAIARTQARFAGTGKLEEETGR